MPQPPFHFYDMPDVLADALRDSLALLPRRLVPEKSQTKPEVPQGEAGPPLAVVGVGNALRGDDAFGPAVVAALEPCPALRLFDVQAVPESFLVPIVSSGCAGVLFVDAADLGAEPGRVALVPAEHLAEVDVSTHAISLALVAEAIQGLARSESGRHVPCALLGAQPADLTTADRLSPAMESAVQLAAAALRAFASSI
ncbi:MAG TPA: hydrogenase maturation protease [Phycisphaerae bacterium]|nr:hydrogenase maturation protease [Phycisphaerae bacterium]